MDKSAYVFGKRPYIVKALMLNKHVNVHLHMHDVVKIAHSTSKYQYFQSGATVAASHIACFSTYRQRFVSSISPFAVLINSTVRLDSNDLADSWQPVVNTSKLYSPGEMSARTQLLCVENQINNSVLPY